MRDMVTAKKPWDLESLIMYYIQGMRTDSIDCTTYVSTPSKIFLLALTKIETKNSPVNIEGAEQEDLVCIEGWSCGAGVPEVSESTR